MKFEKSYRDGESVSALTAGIYDSRVDEPNPLAFINSWSVYADDSIGIRPAARLIKDENMKGRIRHRESCLLATRCLAAI